MMKLGEENLKCAEEFPVHGDGHAAFAIIAEQPWAQVRTLMGAPMGDA